MRSKRRPSDKPLAGLSVKWLAAKCACPVDFLWAIARDTENLYRPTRKQQKKSGGFRLIDAPRPQYKGILRRVCRVLSEAVGVHAAWHGGAKGKSSFTSARCHAGKPFLITRDIKNCYPSIGPKQLSRAFLSLGANRTFAGFLSSIMTVRNRIPQGGPLSNLAVNLFFMRQDEHLMRLARQKGGRYGRLTDDFVMSTKSRAQALSLAKVLDDAIESRSLKINARKRARKGFLEGDQLKELHSLVVNSRRAITPKREHARRALSLAEDYARRCKCATPEDLMQLAHLRSVVSGWIYYLRQADKSPGKHMRWMVSIADLQVLRLLRRKGLHPRKGKWWAKKEAPRLMRLWKRKTGASSTAA